METNGQRWVRTASSDLLCLSDAVRDSLTATVDMPNPKLAILMIHAGYDDDEVAKIVAEASWAYDIVSIRTSETLAPSEAIPSVVATVLGGCGFAANSAISSAKDLHDAATLASEGSFVDDHEFQHQAMLTFSDGYAGDQDCVIAGIFSVVGASVPIVGGAGGDGRLGRRVGLGQRGKFSEGNVAVTHLRSNSPIGIGVSHGWLPVGDPVVVTDVDGLDILEIDGMAALDVYLRQTGAPGECSTDIEDFRAYAFTHPFGLSRKSRTIARFVTDADLDRGSVRTMAPLPRGGLVWLMEGSQETVLDATTTASKNAFAALGGQSPIGAFAFDCVARRSILGEQRLWNEEYAVIGSQLPPNSLAGFYTHGEFARVSGVEGFHNKTMVVLAFS
jgi:hypothetical protein